MIDDQKASKRTAAKLATLLSFYKASERATAAAAAAAGRAIT